MGTFPLPSPPHVTNIATVNMISSFTSVSLGFSNPWVVPHPDNVEYYGASIPLSIADIFYPKIFSASGDTGQQLNPHMGCDQPTPPVWVVDSPSAHDFLDSKLPPDEDILDIMDSIDDLKDEVTH
jgi:hypothetical protein